MSKLEFRRQTIHLLYGPLLIITYHLGIINETILLGGIIGGSIASFMIKKKKLNLISKVLRFFERDHHMEKFPGRGILFFTIGSFICLISFKENINIAYAGIMILSIGDALTNIIGRHFGSIICKLNRNKCIEGTIIAIMAVTPVSYFLVPELGILASLSAACVSMFLEIPHIKIFGFEIDDNLIIPVSASFTLYLFS